MTKTAAKYLRISQDRDDDERGVTRQDKDEAELAARRGLAVVATFADNDASATFGGPRAGYEAMMTAAASGEFGVILVWQLSRLWRNRIERAHAIEILRRAQVAVYACKGPDLDFSTAYGRGMAGMLGEVDTMEVEIKGERTQAAQRQAAEAGLWVGGPRPFGWDLIPDPARAGRSSAHRLVLPVVNEAEAGELRRLTAGLLAGETLGTLVRGLNERGVSTTWGRKWTATSLRVTLSRPRNYGAVDYQGEILPGAAWPPILSEADHRKVVALLADPTRRQSDSNQVKYLLSGLGKCGKCGLRVKAGSVKRRDGTRRRLYKCPDEHVHRTVTAVDAVVEGTVIARITAAKLSPADAAGLVGAEDAGLAAEAAQLRDKIAEALAMWEAGEITRAEHRTSSARLRARLAQVEKRMARRHRTPVLAGLLSVADVAAAWGRLTLAQQRAIITDLMQIEILPVGKTGGYKPGESLTEERVGLRIGWTAP